MAERPRIVIDTNVLVSRLLVPRSVPAQAVRHAADHGRLLVSEATLTELADVLARPKFDAYLSVAERRQFLVVLMRLYGQGVINVQRIAAVLAEWDDPSFEYEEYGRQPTAWRLFNAVTTALRGRAVEDYTVTQTLHDIVDTECEPLQLAAE